MQQHLNEFNIYQPSVDAIYQTVEMLPGMFYAFDELLAATDGTRAGWTIIPARCESAPAMVPRLSFLRSTLTLSTGRCAYIQSA